MPRSLHSLAADTPAGYRFELDGPGRAWMVRESARAALCAAGFGPARNGPLEASGIAGRQPLQGFRLGAERALLRSFARGGLARHLGLGFRDPARPFAELALSERLRGAGLPTPEVLFARARQRGRRFELELCTRRIEGAVDLSSWLQNAGLGAPGAGSKRRWIERLGHNLGAWMASGFEHADLTPRNFLLAPVPGGVGSLWVLDLDKSRLGAPLPAARREALLARLWRHIARRPRLRAALSRADRARFLRAFAAGSTQRALQPAPDGERFADLGLPRRELWAGARRRWFPLWRAVERRHRRGLALHRLGWALEALLGRRPRDL
jgi:hypothetical protein